MESPNLSISIGELLGVPKVTLRGNLDGWHDQAVSGILTVFRDEGTSSMVLDIAAINFTSTAGATGLINVLRSLGPRMCVHVVASDTPASILGKAGFGSCVRLYSSTEELAKHVTTEPESLTSRWIASTELETRLPRAA